MLRVVGSCQPQPTGADLWRIAEPIEHLHRLGYNCGISLRGDPKHPVKAKGEKADVLIVSRSGVAPGLGEKIVFPEIEAETRALIWDLDDDFWHLEADNPWREKNPPVSWLETMARRADLITTTTVALGTEIRRHLPEAQIRVVPNLIRLARFAFAEAVEGPVTICLQGGYHDRDWSGLREILVRVLRDHPDVTLRVIGDYQEWLSELPSEQVEWSPFQPYLKWPKLLQGISIGLAPLRPSTFNRGKSPIKFFEYSVVGAATIASPTVYETVIEHGKTGLLAETPKEWEEAIRLLLSDYPYRRQIATRAASVVAERYSLESRAETIYPGLWEEAYALWQRKQRRSTRDSKRSCETRSLQRGPELPSPTPGGILGRAGFPSPGAPGSGRPSR